MNAAAAVAEAEVRGLVLVPAGDRLRVRGPLPADLCARLLAFKPAVLQLLRAREARRLWRDAGDRLSGVWPGREAVGQLDPDLLRDFDEAEADAEHLTERFVEGRASVGELSASLRWWEALVCSAFWNATRICDFCRDKPTVAVLPSGRRCCEGCYDSAAAGAVVVIRHPIDGPPQSARSATTPPHLFPVAPVDAAGLLVPLSCDECGREVMVTIATSDGIRRCRRCLLPEGAP